MPSGAGCPGRLAGGEAADDAGEAVGVVDDRRLALGIGTEGEVEVLALLRERPRPLEVLPAGGAAAVGQPVLALPRGVDAALRVLGERSEDREAGLADRRDLARGAATVAAHDVARLVAGR